MKHSPSEYTPGEDALEPVLHQYRDARNEWSAQILHIGLECSQEVQAHIPAVRDADMAVLSQYANAAELND